jgi:hypothetical protein
MQSGATNDQIRRLLHELWSAAVGTPDYDKASWKQLESELTAPVGWTSLTIPLVRKLRAAAATGVGHDGSKWDALERLVFRDVL